MHFLGVKKREIQENALNAETQRAQRENLRKTGKYGVEKLVEWDVGKVVEWLWRRSVYPREVGAGFLFLGMFVGSWRFVFEVGCFCLKPDFVFL